MLCAMYCVVGMCGVLELRVEGGAVEEEAVPGVVINLSLDSSSIFAALAHFIGDALK